MALDISVIVPCFNEAGNLRELVDRLEASFRVRSLDAEIILVNDGSRDNTGSVIRELEAGHPAVRGVHHDTNLGIAAGWRSGLAVARGAYACLIDADLQYQPEDVCRQIGRAHV